MSESLGRTAVGGTIWSFAGQIVSLAVTGISLILLARWLGPREYGYLPIINSVVAFLLIFADFGISASTARYISQEGLQDRERGTRIVRDGLTSILLSATVVTMLCMWSGRLIATMFKEPALAYLAPMGAVLLFGRTMLRFLVKVSQGFHEIRRAAGYSMLSESMIGILALILVLAGGGVAGALWGRAAGAWLGTLVVFLIVSHRKLHGPSGAAPSYRRRVLSYSLPLMLTTSSFYIYVQSSPLLIGYFLDSAQVAFYNVPQALIQKLQLPAVALGSTIGPLYGALFSTTDRERITRLFALSTKYVCALYLPLTAGLILTASPLVHLLLGEAYAPAAVIVRIYAPFLLFFALSAVVSPIFDYAGRARFRARVIFASAVVNVMMNLMLIPRLGIAGAAVSALATYCPAVLILFVAAGKWCGAPFTARRREAIILIFAAALAMSTAWLLLDHARTWIGFITMTAAAGVVYILVMAVSGLITWSEVKAIVLRRGEVIS
ncbi:flippase [bacterium]|nr:flippase [candidate division CSSED10-310 bacterium]